MKFFSLFAGVGGFDLGLERSGMQCVGQCEIDPFCQKVLAKHWPNVWRHGDIKTLTGAMIHDQCGQIDLLCGGFPCQDISFCGNGAGLDGDRSRLWWEMFRIIRELIACQGRKLIVVLENVSALLERGLGAILAALASIRFDAEWECLQASAFGGYHKRDRLFVVAYAAGVDGGSHDLLEARGEWGSSLQSRRLYCMDDALRGRQANARLECEPGLARLVRRVPGAMDRLEGIGDSIFPACAEFIGRRIMDWEAQCA